MEFKINPDLEWQVQVDAVLEALRPAPLDSAKLVLSSFDHRALTRAPGLARSGHRHSVRGTGRGSAGGTSGRIPSGSGIALTAHRLA
ncbi:hypothetical protein [Reinekea sp.]|uniref:hypothetical protein n=1 Tax=Reinekea sp. TaxID=1970455 RepID=UPI002A806DE2|nr:hypothetical protein [Reinekea sp.]